MSRRLFLAICGAVTTGTCELAVVRRTAMPRRWETLLIARPEGDPFYAGRMHGPGGVFHGHQTAESVLRRVVEKELSVPFSLLERQIAYVGGRLATPARGQEIAVIYVLVLPATYQYNGPGTFFAFEALPETILDHHRVIADDVASWLTCYSEQAERMAAMTVSLANDPCTPRGAEDVA